MEEALTKKNARAQKVATFFTDSNNLNLNAAIKTLVDIGATVFVSERAVVDPYAREIVMAGKSAGHLRTISLSQLGIMMTAEEGNIYRFMLSEIRMVTEKEKEGVCVVNLNNIVFFEAWHEYFEPLSVLLNTYDAYEKYDIATEGWLVRLSEQLKADGGTELIEQWEKIRKEKSQYISEQKYFEVAELREQENLVLAQLQELLEKLLFSETENS